LRRHCQRPYIGRREIHSAAITFALISYVELPSPPPVDLTRMLQAWSDGDTAALDRLTPVVYAELHRLARQYLAREREGHLLQPSALVNEAFVRLLGGAPVEWDSRAHFFAVSARLMRQILIDFARAQDTVKRGNRAPHVDLSDIKEFPGPDAVPIDFLDLDEARTGLLPGELTCLGLGCCIGLVCSYAICILSNAACERVKWMLQTVHGNRFRTGPLHLTGLRRERRAVGGL